MTFTKFLADFFSPKASVKQGSPPGAARRYAPADGSSTVAKIAADLHPSADGSAVRTSLVAGGGQAQAVSVPTAYSLASCAVGQKDRQTDRAVPKCPPKAGHNKCFS